MSFLSALFGSEKKATAKKEVVNPLLNTFQANTDLGFFGEEVARIGHLLAIANSTKDAKTVARCTAALFSLNSANEESGYAMARPSNLQTYRLRKARGEFPYLTVK